MCFHVSPELLFFSPYLPLSGLLLVESQFGNDKGVEFWLSLSAGGLEQVTLSSVSLSFLKRDEKQCSLAPWVVVNIRSENICEECFENYKSVYKYHSYVKLLMKMILCS